MANIQAATVTTTAGAGSNLVRAYFDRVLLERAKQQTRFYQFGVPKPLPLTEGASVTWNRKRALALGLELSQGVPTSTGYTLSTTQITRTIRQFGAHVPISDLIDLTAIADVGVLATEELADQAGRTIDRVIQLEIINHASATDDSCHYLFKTSTEVTDYWGSTSTISAGVMTVSSANVMATSDLRTCTYFLRRQGAEPYDGSNYIGILNTETAEDIAGDTTWVNWHQYAGDPNAVQNLYNGEIGKVYGIRVIEDNFGPSKRGSNSGGTASTIAYGTVVFGKGFYGITELDGGIKTMGPITGPSKSDPLDQTRIYGWKCNFATAVLNTSAGITFFAGSGDTAATVTESAGGPRDTAVTTY